MYYHLSYISLISNEKNCDVLQDLDKFNGELEQKFLMPICTFNWIKLLKEFREEESKGGKNNFEELTDRGIPTSYTIAPSSLLRLIRNVEQHAAEKVLNPSNRLLKRIFSNGSRDKHDMMCYFLEKFPKLIPALLACRDKKKYLLDWKQKCLVGQVITGLWNSFQYETDHGNFLGSYTCILRTNRKPFNLEIYHVSKDLFHLLRGTIVKVQSNKLIVYKGGKSIEYLAKTSTPYCFTLGIDHLSEESISERVIVLTFDSDITKIRQELPTFIVVRSDITSTSWFDVSESKRTKLVNSLIVKIQNNSYKLKDLCPNSSSLESLEGQELNSVLKHNCIEVFRPKSDRNSIHYVKRYLDIGEVTSDFFDKPETSLYILVNVRRKDYKSISEKLNCEVQHFNVDVRPFNRIVAKVVTISIKSQYSTAIENIKDLVPDKSVFILKYHNGWFNQLVSEDVLYKNLDDLQFISGSPGFGKTTILRNLNENIEGVRHLTLLIKAADLIGNLDINFTEEDFRESFIDCFANNTLEKAILASLLDNNFTITLLLDAIDEVNSSKTWIIIKAIRSLLKLKNLRVVGSFRSYLENDYKKMFDAKMYRLHEISYNDRLLIIRGHLATKYDEKGDLETINQIGKRIMDLFKLNVPLTPFLIICLVDIYAEYFVNKDDSQKHGFDNIVDVYSKIVDKNFYLYLKEKAFMPNQLMKHDISQIELKRSYLRGHMYLALQEVYPQYAYKFAGAFNTWSELTAGQGFLESIHPVKFTHRSFAEYFIDMWSYYVMSGCFILDQLYVQTFTIFYRERYIISKSDHFLENILSRYSMCVSKFGFHFESIDIFECLRLHLSDCTHKIGDFVISSLYHHSIRDIHALLERDKHKSIDVSTVVGIEVLPSNSLCTVPSALLNCAVALGSYALFMAVFDHEKERLMGTEEDSVELVKYLLRVSLYRSANDNSYKLYWKTATLEHLFDACNFPLSKIKLQGDRKNKLFMAETTSLELMMCLTKHGVNLTCMHSSASPSFLDQFTTFSNLYSGKEPDKHRFPEAFYSTELDSVQTRRLTNLLSCLEEIRPNSSKAIGKVFFHEKLMMELSKHRNNRPSDWYTGPEYRISSLLSAYNSLADIANESPEEITDVAVHFKKSQNKLANYYVAVHVLNNLKDNAECPKFQKFFIEQVLECRSEQNTGSDQTSVFEELMRLRTGVRHRYPTICCLIDKMLETLPNLELKLCNANISLFQSKSSPFISACQSGNIYLARLLAKSFHKDWLKDKTDTELFSVFQALSECREGDCLLHVVGVLEQSNYQVPVGVVRNVLNSCDFELFKTFVTRLGFSVDKWSSIDPDPDQQLGIIHIIIKSSLCYHKLDIRKNLVNYIIELDPEQLEIRDKLGRTPLLIINVNFELIKYLIEKGANVHAVDNEGNNMLHVYFQTWKNNYPNGTKHYDEVIYLANVMVSGINDKNKPRNAETK